MGVEPAQLPRVEDGRALLHAVERERGGEVIERKEFGVVSRRPAQKREVVHERFLHEPEPTAENLRELGPVVKQHGAHIGFALDPDADRLALLDEDGRYIGEELTLALAVQFRLGRERGPVVVNMSTSRVVDDIAAKYGCPFSRSAVGEANVADRMIERPHGDAGQRIAGKQRRNRGGQRHPRKRSPQPASARTTPSSPGRCCSWRSSPR